MANHAAAVTPSDTVPLLSGSAWLSFVNTGGTQALVIDTVAGELGVSILLPSGMWPIRAAKVRAATSVTSIVAYWD